VPDDSGIVVTRAEELNHIGAQFFGQGEMEPARLHFLAALSLEPNNPRALQNLGAVLRNLRHFEAAASVARRSVVASGNNPMCRSNLGVSLLAIRQFDEALATLHDVVTELPTSGPSWHNYGLVLYMLGRYDEALYAFEHGLQYTPGNAQMRSDRALTLLSLGELQAGLVAYEVRWNILKRNAAWNIGVPEWQGEALDSCHILVHHEQGFGDSIMLVRFMKQLAVKGCRITLAVPTELMRLFERSFNYIKVVDMSSITEAADEKFDYHAPMLSVMRHLDIGSPHEIDATPYLLAEPTVPVNLPKAKLRVGICWASGNHGAVVADRRRVVPLTQFLPLSEIPGVALISLQKGKESYDIMAQGLEGIVYDLSHRLEDFAHTADVMANLDLIISVDSAVAHLAGAIGKPCLMLSPYSRCWRWWNFNGQPWYRDMLQFTQSQDGTWNEAMADVTAEVRAGL
jgi:Flp pilus assembly protein TadD